MVETVADDSPVVKRRPKQNDAGPPLPLVIVVEHCINCGQHQYCTRHNAKDYDLAFNNLKRELSIALPSAEVIQN